MWAVMLKAVSVGMFVWTGRRMARTASDGSMPWWFRWFVWGLFGVCAVGVAVTGWEWIQAVKAL